MNSLFNNPLQKMIGKLNQHVIQDPAEDVTDVHYKDERTDSEPGKNGKN